MILNSDKRVILISIMGMVLLLLLFPTKVKIQFEAPDLMPEIAGYDNGNRMIPYNTMKLEELGYIHYYVVDWNDLKKCDSIRIRFEGIDNASEVVISEIKIALGNHIILNFNPAECGNRIEHVKDYIEIKNLQSLIAGEILKCRVLYLLIGSILILLTITISRKRTNIMNVKEVLNILEKISLADAVRHFAIFSLFLVCGFIVVKLIEVTGVNCQIHNGELILFFIAEYFVFELVRKRTKSYKHAGVVCTVSIIGILISVERLITYLTVDETASIKYIYAFPDDTLRAWIFNESRVTYVIMCTLWKIIPHGLLNLNEINYQQLAKILHWLVGFTILLMITDLAQNKILNIKKSFSQNKIAFNYSILLNGLLLFPVLELGMKNYNNYDLFSMLLGVLGFEMLYLGVKNKNTTQGWIGFLIEWLSCIEKCSNLPMYVLAGVLLLLIYYMKDNRLKFRKSLIILAKMISASVLTCWLIQVYVINILANNNTQIYSYRKAITMVAMQPMRFVVILGKLLKNKALMEGNNVAAYFASYVVMFLGMYIAGAVFYLIYKKAKNINEQKVKLVSLLCVLMYILVGIVLVYCGPKYDGETYFSFFIEFMRRFVNAIPSLLLVVLGFNIVMYKRNSRGVLIYISLPTGIIGVTVVYTLIKEYIAPRYFNIYLLCFCLILLIITLQTLNEMLDDVRIQAVVTGILVLGLSMEIIVGAPAYSYFYPVWNRSLNRDDIGIRVYWGEQISVAGRIIEEYCLENNLNMEEVKIYTGYDGHWLTNKYEIEIIKVDKWTDDASVRETDVTDFYLIDSQALIRGMIPYEWEWPYNEITPWVTLYCRNGVIARIYQGSQLEEYFKSLE